MTIRTMRAQADGIIPELRVVGFHGQLGIDQTPALRAPVFADMGRLARVVEASPDGASGYLLTVDVASKPISEEVWSTTGTRIDPPWPAQLGDVVVIIGRRESEVIDALLADSATPPKVANFLRWIGTNIDRSDQLRCTRVGELVAWYTSVSAIKALRRLIADQVRTQVIDAARQGDMTRLMSKSFWLSRAAVEVDDLVLAVAGLRQAESPYWELVLDSGITTGTKNSRREQVDAVLIKLRRESPTVRTPAARSRMARRHVAQSMQYLPHAGPNNARSAA